MFDYKHIARQIFFPYGDRPRPVDWNSVFIQPRPLQVEIGFGQGEYLLDCLNEDRQRNYVGFELDWGRICKCFAKVARLPPEQQQDVLERLKVLQVDAWVALKRLFCQRTLAGAVCLFPCPWPKDRHEKHRLFSKGFLELLNSRLQNGARVQCVTDHRPYVDWILEQASGTGFQVTQKKIPPHFQTKFERKWVSEGQEEFCELVFEKQEHRDVPVEEDVQVQAFYHEAFFPQALELRDWVSEEVAIVPKEWVFDPNQQKGLARLVVSEEHLTQHLWVVVVKTEKGWCVVRAEGQHVLPSPGVARAIKLVSDAVGEAHKEDTSHKAQD